MSTVSVDAATRASTLIEALPYMRAYRGKTAVVKIGGAALDDEVRSQSVAHDLALMALVGMRLVIVHGGGPQVSAAMIDAGIEPSFVDGLRVTEPATMEIVRRVLIGTINTDLVARLSGAGLQPVGLSGFDGTQIRADRATGTGGSSLGRVGHVREVSPALITSLLDDGYTPVIASVAPDDDGSALNVNADDVAGAVAGALGAAKLIYLTNVDGLYKDLGDEGSLISEIKLDELEALAPRLSTGMRPKVDSAIAALHAGVEKAHILDGRVEHALLLEIFTDGGAGTLVLA
ncbi:MAG: acetylglutamate kinase [Actinomycetota bacterium]|nr:acetylglutamate kinase [Actinomycetota bacterium]